MPDSTPKSHRIKVRYLIIAWFLIEFGLKLIIYWTGHWQLFRESRTFVGIFNIVSAVAIYFWAFRLCNRSRISVTEIFGRIPQQIDWHKIITLAIVTILFAFGISKSFLSVRDLLLLEVFPRIHSDLYNLGNYQSGIDLMTRLKSLEYRSWDFIELVIIAPLVEEFLFRGVIFKSWSNKWSTERATIASAILFGIAHLNWDLNLLNATIATTMFGLIAVLLYIKYQSLWIPIFFHAVYNLLAFVGNQIPLFWIPIPIIDSDLRRIIYFNMLQGLAIAGISLFLTTNFIKRNFPKRVST